jgi:hypothetical protein
MTNVLLEIVAGLQVALISLAVSFWINRRDALHYAVLQRRWRDDYRRVGQGYESYLNREVDRIIERAERKNELELTWGARQMLAIPVVETAEIDRGALDLAQLSNSIDTIMETMREQPDPAYNEPYARGVLTSVAVIRAFAERFCNIPPFCSRRG